MEQWQRLAQRYGRDYSWLGTALEMFGGSVRQTERSACITLQPWGECDFGMQYGLAPGLTLHFLLEEPEAEQADPTLPVPPLNICERLCIPVKTGRAALGWQLSTRLDAIRPLALLRPFYLFCPPLAAPSGGEIRRTPLADARRLGRLLDNGWVGIDRCALTQEVLLQKRVSASQ